MTELNFSIRWQSTGSDHRDGHVGETYPGLRQKYSYRYFIAGNGKPPRRWVARYRSKILDRFETLTEAKDACQKHWESQPENPKFRQFTAETRIVGPVERAGIEHAAVRIPCENTMEPTWDRTETDLQEAGLQDMITKAEYDTVQEAFWTLVNVEKAIRERRNLGPLHFATAPKDDPYVLIGNALGKLARVNKKEAK
jgi:hypothetical protein